MQIDMRFSGRRWSVKYYDAKKRLRGAVIGHKWEITPKQRQEARNVVPGLGDAGSLKEASSAIATRLPAS